MSLKQLDGYDLTQCSDHFHIELQLKDSEPLEMALGPIPATYGLGHMQYYPDLNLRYSPVLRARQNGLKPFSLKTVYIDPTSYFKDDEMLETLKDQVEKIRSLKMKKSVDLIGHQHVEGKFDGYFELEDGSKHVIQCTQDLLGVVLTFGSNASYRGKSLTGLSVAGKYQAVRISTDKRNAFIDFSESDIYLFDGFDLKTGAIKNVKLPLPDGRYSAEGLLNELSLASKAGIKVDVKEININDFTNKVFSADAIVEKNGKSELYKLPASNGLLIGKLFDAPVLVDDGIAIKVRQFEQEQIKQHQLMMRQLHQQSHQTMDGNDDTEEDSDKDEKKPIIQ